MQITPMNFIGAAFDGPQNRDVRAIMYRAMQEVMGDRCHEHQAEVDWLAFGLSSIKFADESEAEWSIDDAFAPEAFLGTGPQKLIIVSSKSEVERIDLMRAMVFGLSRIARALSLTAEDLGVTDHITDTY